MEQFLVGSQCILLEPAPARPGGSWRRLDLGVEAEQSEHQRLQRIPAAPADRLGQVDLLPAGRLAIEHPLEAQVKTAPRALVAVLRGGEDDATVPGQHGLQQRGGNGGGFVHQQQVGLQRLVHQPIRRTVAEPCQRLRRVFEDKGRVGKQGGYRGLGGGRHQDLQIGLLAQQLGGGQPQQAALAAAPIRAQHQRAAAVTVQHLVDGGQGAGLITAQWSRRPNRLPQGRRGWGRQLEGGVTRQQPYQPGEKAVTRQRHIFRLCHQPNPVRIRPGRPLGSRRGQQQQQAARPQGARQRPERIGVKTAERIEHKRVALLTESLQRLGRRLRVVFARAIPQPVAEAAKQRLGPGDAIGLITFQPDQPPFADAGQRLAQLVERSRHHEAALSAGLRGSNMRSPIWSMKVCAFCTMKRSASAGLANRSERMKRWVCSTPSSSLVMRPASRY